MALWNLPSIKFANLSPKSQRALALAICCSSRSVLAIPNFSPLCTIDIMAAVLKQSNKAPLCIRMESVNRITKLPVVESTMQGGRNIYNKMKEYNALTNWTMSTAEYSVIRVVEVGRPFAAPIAQSLKKPVRYIDVYLCKGLDFVESKVPAMKLPPNELYASTVDYINSYSGAKMACCLVKPAMDSAVMLRCRLWNYSDVLSDESVVELKQQEGNKHDDNKNEE